MHTDICLERRSPASSGLLCSCQRLYPYVLQLQCEYLKEHYAFEALESVSETF